MRVRESNEREGEKGGEGGLLSSRFNWWVLEGGCGEGGTREWGGAGLKRTVGSMMVL